MAKPSRPNSNPSDIRKARGKLELSSAQAFIFSAILLTLPLLLQSVYPKFAPLHLYPHLHEPSPPNPSHNDPVDPDSPALLQACHHHRYTTQLISLDPLMIYINNFTSPLESSALIALGSPDFTDSFISRADGSGTRKVSGRTSQSAPLEPSHPLVSCIIARARSFLGTVMREDEPFSTPQLVRYLPSQRYDLHTDFWPTHQLLADGSGRRYNRPASFFVFLRDNCTEGETWFPAVEMEEGRERGFGGRVKRGRRDGEEEEGKGKGLRFRPVEGSAVFWVNIGGDGKGDRRVVHAGLPVGEGEKIGMNIWPRKFYADEG